MIAIDPRTVVLLAGVMSGFMAIILFSLKRSYPPAIKGLGEWGVASVMAAVGSMLAFGLGSLPNFVAITIPRLLLPLAFLLAYVGAQRFFGIVPRVGPWLLLIGTVIVVQMWFTYVSPSFAMRLTLSNALAACLFLAFANLMRKQGTNSFAKTLTTVVLGTMFVIIVMRLLTLLVWPPGDSVFESSPQQLIYLTAFAFFVVLLAVSLVLLAAERLHAEMAYLASHDSLTNALTRRHMNELCAIELDRSQRHGHSMALLIMDLDHFKQVNDTYGHQGGDRVLTEFVAKAQRLLRRPDLMARFGGEEFVALLPQTSLSDAVSVAQRIREACERFKPGEGCTVSIGVATNLASGDTIDSLIARADKAMYQAKANGRNRVESA